MRDSAFSGSVHQTRNVVIHELIHSGSVNGSGVGSLANVPREHIFTMRTLESNIKNYDVLLTLEHKCQGPDLDELQRWQIHRNI